MPRVGKKKFAYTDQGKQSAYEYARSTNQPIVEVNQFGNDVKGMSLDKSRFGRRDKKKNNY